MSSLRPRLRRGNRAVVADRRAPGLLPPLILAPSAGALAVAFTAEFVFGIAGCTLCIYQRVPYAIAAALAVMALAGRASPSKQRLLFGACAVLFGGGCAVAASHVGVRHGWRREAGFCQASAAQPLTITDLREGLAMRRGRPACNEIDWSVFGLSLTAFNLMYSAGLATFCVVMKRWILQRCAATPARAWRKTCRRFHDVGFVGKVAGGRFGQ